MDRHVTMTFVARVKAIILIVNGARDGAREGAVLGGLWVVASMEDAIAPHTG